VSWKLSDDGEVKNEHHVGKGICVCEAEDNAITRQDGKAQRTKNRSALCGFGGAADHPLYRLPRSLRLITRTSCVII